MSCFPFGIRFRLIFSFSMRDNGGCILQLNNIDLNKQEWSFWSVMSGGESINLVLKNFRSNRSQFAALRTCSYSRTGMDQNLTISACLFLEEALYFSSHRSLVGCPTQTQKQNNLRPLPSASNFLSIQLHALLFPQHHIETIFYPFRCTLYMLFPCLCWWPHHFIHSKIFKASMHSPHAPPPSILSETIHSTWIILSLNSYRLIPYI